MVSSALNVIGAGLIISLVVIGYVVGDDDDMYNIPGGVRRFSVDGTLLCNDSNWQDNGDVVLKASTTVTNCCGGRNVYKYIEEGKANEHGEFHLQGVTTTPMNEKAKIVIYTKCNGPLTSGCYRVLEERFVFEPSTGQYHFGRIELYQKRQNEDHICSYDRKANDRRIRAEEKRRPKKGQIAPGELIPVEE